MFAFDGKSAGLHCGSHVLMNSIDPGASSRGNHSGTVVVLASGGIDSTACIWFYLSRGSSVEALFIDYGQRSAKKEEEAVRNVAAHFQIKLRVFRCQLGEFGPGLVLGRNGFFLNLALVAMGTSFAIIAIGVHAGTSYFDCSQTFVREMQKLFDLQTDGLVQIGTPFIDWEKPAILHYCLVNGLPVDLTYSCENGQIQPCDCCLSCNDLKNFYAMAR